MTVLDTPRPIVVQLALAATMVIWGVSFVASKIVLSSLTPLTYMGVRLLLASIVFAIVLAVRGRPRFSRRQHLFIALTALAEPISYFLFESFGLNRTTATTASLIIATIPLMVMVFARIFLGESISARGFVAVILSIIGIILLVGTGGQTQNDPIGVLLVFGAVLSASAYITMARFLGRSTDSTNLTIWQTWWGGLVFVSLWIAQPEPARSVRLDTTGWAALAFLVLGATLAAYLLYNWALRYETANHAAIYINGIPVVTAITAWAVLGERLTPLQIFGAVLVVISVRFATRETAR